MSNPRNGATDIDWPTGDHYDPPSTPYNGGYVPADTRESSYMREPDDRYRITDRNRNGATDVDW